MSRSRSNGLQPKQTPDLNRLNGNLSAAVDLLTQANPGPTLPELLLKQLPTPNQPLDDAAVFALFSLMAEKVGRPDLVEEFKQRADPANNTLDAQAKYREHGPAKPLPVEAPKPTPIPPLVGEGLRLLQEGKLAEAVEKLQEACLKHPEEHSAHGNLGVAYARLKRFAEAEACFRETLRLRPESANMCGNLGASCLDQGKLAEAEEAFREGTIRDPKRADFHHHLGNVLDARGQHAVAIESYQAALKLEASDAEWHAKLGRLLAKVERLPEAEASFREATRLRPDNAGHWKHLGAALEGQTKSAEAEAAYRTALGINPNDPETHNNLGVSLAGQNKLAEAEEMYRKALELAPKMVMVHNNLGHNLRMQDRLEEAEVFLKQAIELQPNYAEARNNLGIVYVQQKRMTEALTCYEEAIQLRPDYPEARLNRALSWLTAANFEQGWPEYEWRFRLRNRKYVSSVPRWDGSPLNGRTILLQSEQGLGDTVQFIRYAALIPRGTGGTVVVECQEGLVDLARTCPGIDRVVPRGQPLPNADIVSPLLSLPGIVKTDLTNIPASIPYVTTDPTRVAYWQAEVENIEGRRVGISWQGSLDHKGDKARSVALSRFQTLANVRGLRLCSLQKGTGIEQLTDGSIKDMEILDFGSRTQASYADTAALLRCLDLVVTVDTSLAHVAGALGVPVWVMMPYASDWRWLENREDTPWYPTMRLFRQPKRGDWDSVFDRIVIALHQWPDRLRVLPKQRKKESARVAVAK